MTNPTPLPAPQAGAETSPAPFKTWLDFLVAGENRAVLINVPRFDPPFRGDTGHLEEFVITASVQEKASAELAALRSEREALRERVADLEMMLRVAAPLRRPRWTIEVVKDKHGARRSFALVEFGDGVEPDRRWDLADDGTGLPLLDAAARAALGKGVA